MAIISRKLPFCGTKHGFLIPRARLFQLPSRGALCLAHTPNPLPSHGAVRVAAETPAPPPLRGVVRLAQMPADVREHVALLARILLVRDICVRTRRRPTAHDRTAVSVALRRLSD